MTDDLRKQAEARLALSSEPLAATSPAENQRLLHELRVHQIELELQSEELRKAQTETEAGRQRYLDLYDLAPVGYLTVGGKGLILEANLTAATLLGVNRAALVRQPLTRFILKEDQDLYHLLRKRLPETPSDGAGQAGLPQTCELRLVKPDGSFFWARLDATASENPDGAPAYRVVLSDTAERKQRDAVYAFLARTSGGTADETFFQALARYLAQSLGMDFVCIDRLEGDGMSARTVAVWCDGRFEDNVTYALKDTPCGDAVGKAVCCFPASVCQFFPRDQVLHDLRAESYVGVTLFSHAGQPIGLIAVISRQPLANRPQAEAILQTVGHRAAAELERLDAEAALRENEKQLRSILDATPFPIALVDPQDSIIEYWSGSAMALFGHTAPTVAEWYQKAYPDPDYRREVIARWRPSLEEAKRSARTINTGEYRVTCRDGSVRICELHANFVAGKLVVTFNDITERKQAEASLRQIEWMLSGNPTPTGVGRSEDHDQGYGDLTELNRDGLILKSIGLERLKGLADEYLGLLGTSSAIYEANGDYAFGIFSSGWCRMMDGASRGLCDTPDNVEALNSGRWLCHESCWTDCSKKAVAQGAPVDIECHGGIRIYAVPIMAHGNVVGVMNFGYGDPPKAPEALHKLAAAYNVNYHDLVREANAYNSRPPFIFEQAKQRLQTTARIIGSMIETKQSEEALRKSDETLRTTLHSIGDGVISADMKGRVTSMNPVAESLTGWSHNEAACQPMETVFQIINEQTRMPVESPVTHVLESGHIVGRANQTLLLARDGREIPITDSSALIRNDAGEISGVVLVFRDQTKERAAQKALQESEMRFMALHNASFGGIAIHDKGLILECNQGLSEITGYAHDELIGMDGLSLISDRTRDRVRRNINAGYEKPYEAEGVRKDGGIYPLRLEARNIRYKGKDVRVVEFRDITERKQVEEALRESEDRFRMLFNQAPLGYQSLDGEGRFLEVNQAWLETLGYGREEVIGKWFGDFLAPEFTDAFRERFSIFKANGKIHSEFQMIHKNGERRFIAFDGRIGYQPDGAFKQTHCILSDITVQRQNEELLRQKYAELERFNNLTVGRELRMIELKTEINGLLKAAGQPEKYEVF